MKKANGKAIIVTISALAIVGGLYYFLIYKKTKGKKVELEDKDVKGKYAYFIKNGFVYTVGTKAQAYPKKNGEYAGTLGETYKDDKDYWLAYNTNAQQILLKKSEVKLS
jgi:hypothetical protein